jgi:hypothetical protein
MPGVLNWPILRPEAPSRFLRSAAPFGALLVTLLVVFVAVWMYRQYDQRETEKQKDAAMRQFIADVVASDGEGAFSADDAGRYFCAEMQKKVSGDDSLYGDLAISDAVAREFLVKLC